MCPATPIFPPTNEVVNTRLSFCPRKGGGCIPACTWAGDVCGERVRGVNPPENNQWRPPERAVRILLKCIHVLNKKQNIQDFRQDSQWFIECHIVSFWNRQQWHKKRRGPRAGNFMAYISCNASRYKLHMYHTNSTITDSTEFNK